ncbi:MAG: M20/M25/M40 family metallo-hydrolase [Candidatus Hydrogenedentes bacterium]|nr:M20/M25/M40 family metallo-hydrolase [Candidatus Hydrogenedentota bacterium]
MLTESQIAVCARYVVERAKHVIESFGPRPPGSEAERKTQELVKADLEACCDGDVSIEEFQVAQKAFFSMQAIGGVLTLAAVGLYWVHPAWTFVVALLSAVVMYNQLLRYHLFLDPFFPKKTSCNVAGKIAPKGKVERRIILNGHPDAAYEWRFNYLTPKWFPAIVLYTLLGLIVLLGGSLVATISFFLAPVGSAWFINLIGIVVLLFAPAGVIGILFNNFGVVAGGANDNLSGTFVATGILRSFQEFGVQLERTELMAVITGSEEAGLRGAKDWARRHARDCSDVETIVISLETFGDLPHVAIYNRDMNGTVALDSETCDLLKRAAHATGRDLPYSSVHLGSSDAAAFAQAGFKAAMFGGMDPHPAHYYHNRRDSWEIMSEPCIKAAIDVLITAIREFDATGLRAPTGEEA